MERIKHYFIQLDLFSEPSPNNSEEVSFEKRTNIIATRVYFILLFLCLFIIALVWSLPRHLEQIEVESPSLTQYESFPSDTLCPCTEYSTPYNTFFTSDPSFHQVCSSVFVSDAWISAFYYGNQQNSFQNDDFRSIGFSFFQTLSMLCRLSRIQVNDILASFYLESLLSLNLLSRINFIAQVSADTNRFRTNALQLFQTRMQIISQLIAGSFLINSLHTSTVPLVFLPLQQNINIQTSLIRLKQEDGSYCNCTVSFSCEAPTLEIFASNSSRLNTSFAIPGLRLRCMPIDTCLHSSLECFFNQSCIDTIVSYMSIALNYNAMIPLDSSRFHAETKVEALAFQLMVEDWGFNATYEKYFDKCAPKSCSYAVATRNTVFQIIGELIGLLSGLCTVLHIVVMIVVFIVQRVHQHRSTPRRIPHVQLVQTRAERLRQMLKSVRNFIVQFNLFKQPNEIEEEVQVHRQRTSTRAYIVLLIVILSILIFYTSLNQQTFIETVINPSESIYFQLESSYSSSLRCQCSQMLINYEIFLNIRPIFHSVCSSDLVSLTWLDLLRENYRPPPFGYADLRSMGAGLFQTLSIFCETANTTIYNSIETFLRRQIVTAEVLSKDLFNTQLKTVIDKWRSGVTYDFLQNIDLFRANMQGNMLLSDKYNFGWHGVPPGIVYLYFYGYLPDISSFEFCSCALSAYCAETLKVLDDNINLLVIEGFFLACTPVTSLMLSNLRSFYNQSFINELHTYIVLNSKNFSLHPLIALDNNRINETIQSIADRSFVDQWIEEYSFTKYYKTCAPRSCTYQIVRHPHYFSIMMTTIAVFGGLSTSLKILMGIILLTLKKFQGQLSWRAIQTWFMGFNDRRRLSTRLNTLLISMAIVGLYLSYAFRKYQQVNEIARDPSLELYLDFVRQYPSGSLYCPCSQASIPYNSFINISVTSYHQICSKDFLTYQWLFAHLPRLVVVVDDPSLFSDVIPNYFQLISEFCQSAQRTVNTSLLQLLTTSLIEKSPNPSPENFQYIIETKIEQFKKGLSQSLIRTLELLREMTHINQLLTIFRSNWKFMSVDPNKELAHSGGYSVTMVPVLYEACDCGLSKHCIKPMTDLDGATISGFMIGCYPVEAFLQSSLECLYNTTCFQTAVSGSTSSMETSSLILNASISSRYHPSTKIVDILNSVFVEEWSTNISYEEYYRVCAPSSCSYSYLKSVPVVEIITNLLGLYGGLTLIMKHIVVPLFIQLGSLFKRPFRRVEVVNH